MAKPNEGRKEPTEVQAEDARVGFADLLNRVGFSDERFIITRYGKPIAALLPMGDFESLPSPSPDEVAAA
jgi:prevent-host-death family protein